MNLLFFCKYLEINRFLPSEATAEEVMSMEQREKYNALVSAGTELFNKSLWESSLKKYREAEALCQNFSGSAAKIEKLRKRIAKIEVSFVLYMIVLVYFEE